MKSYQFPAISALAVAEQSGLIAVRATPLKFLHIPLTATHNSNDEIPSLVFQARVSTERLADLSIALADVGPTSDRDRDNSLVLAQTPACGICNRRAVRRRATVKIQGEFAGPGYDFFACIEWLVSCADVVFFGPRP